MFQQEMPGAVCKQALTNDKIAGYALTIMNWCGLVYVCVGGHLSPLFGMKKAENLHDKA